VRDKREKEEAVGREPWAGLRSRLDRLLVAWLLVLLLPGISASVEVGEKAPDFELPSTTGGKIRLSDFVGKKNVVLEFYVLDFSPV
jgi:hypothetical protein